MGEHRKALANTADRKNHFLLLVESDLDSLKYTAMLLRRFGYQTYTATRAADALEITSAKAPALIITSALLKDMDGLEFIKQIRKDPRTADVSFIVLTRQGDMLQEARCYEAGAMDCISQPVSAELLYRAVQTVIEPTPRMDIRIQTMQPVKVTNMPLDDREGVYTLDLSERGMFVRIAEPAPLNTRLSLQIDLSGRIIPVEAAVLRTDRTGAGPYHQPGMGLGFVRIAPKDRECIREFIKDEVTRNNSAPGNA